MAKLICIYWRDIPAQVVGRAGRKSGFKKELEPRFAKAIDRAAMRAGRGSSDAYLEDWRRVAETSKAISKLPSTRALQRCKMNLRPTISSRSSKPAA